METKIKELKDLGMVYKLALEWDYVPSMDEPQEGKNIEDKIRNYLGIDDLTDVIDIIIKYEGYSTGDIEGKVFNIIWNL